LGKELSFGRCLEVEPRKVVTTLVAGVCDWSGNKWLKAFIIGESRPWPFLTLSWNLSSTAENYGKLSQGS
jgi:hypothetical protein